MCVYKCVRVFAKLLSLLVCIIAAISHGIKSNCQARAETFSLPQQTRNVSNDIATHRTRFGFKTGATRCNTLPKSNLACRDIGGSGEAQNRAS